MDKKRIKNPGEIIEAGGCEVDTGLILLSLHLHAAVLLKQCAAEAKPPFVYGGILCYFYNNQVESAPQQKSTRDILTGAARE